MFNLFPRQPIPQLQIDRMKGQVNAVLYSRLPQPLPKKLWHYTDAAGFKGIIESGNLRTTHLAYLNDASEYLHATTILVDIIRAERLASASSLRRTVLDELDAFVAPTQSEDTAPVFVTCFSTAENTLNQWRAYGSGEGGYSLGFDTQQLLRVTHPNGLLSPVIYDKAVQSSVVETLLRWALDEFEQLCLTDPTLGTDQARRELWWNWFVTICAAAVAPVLKNPAFSEEAEWRYIHLATSHDNIEFLPKPTGLRPFVDVDFKLMMKPDHPAPRLPLTDLWSGPGRSTGVSLLAGRAILEKNKYDGIDLHQSQIPFRVG